MTSRFFAPRRLAHANVFVGDYQRASDYYRDIFGFEEVYNQPDNKASFISNGNTYHDFALVDIGSRYAKPGQQPGLNHVAFEVASEAALVQGYRAAVAAGVLYRSTEDHDVAHSLYQKDPDGNEVEIYADVVEDWRSARKGSFSKKKPKWVPGETNVPVAEQLFPVDPEIRVIDAALVHGRRVSHVALIAQDFGAMFDFYTNIVGLNALAGGRDQPFALLAGTHGMGDIALYRNDVESHMPMHHIGVEVSSEADLDAAIEGIERSGGKLIAAHEHAARRVVFVHDPDGLPIQLYVNRDWTVDTIRSIDARLAPFLI
ncbi:MULTISPECIES: VOC family protein [unclassified Caballeronia]|uniref:VOC family protein n=1 Tax=unclassified Caballeronia TaxID=2646786 RepID=UPI0028582011|nr:MULTISPECIES: VOC family protein [unclassified Caballeronia]MDR5815668.1 VOC family protein [Caballeronia sp. LZ033]MDR5822241.1 VOC family protein [Caballeronia sp. LZ043]MDR5880397.1 VOC family protein [Caballeronia sp. LZ032]